MAFYNGFPATYQPVYTPVQPQPQQNGIIWVQGEAGAKSYLVAPNNTVQLWDSESQTIYLKSADAAGMPSMKILDYTIREAKNGVNSALPGTPGNLSEYAMKSEIKPIFDKITAIEKRLDEMAKEEET